MRRHLIAGGVVSAVLVLASAAAAKDLGSYGTSFPVSETDILQFVASKLQAAQRAGKFEALKKLFVQRARTRIERPTPVEGVSTTTQPRTWLFDPTIIVPQDYADQNGRVFAHAGDRINPLDRMPDFNRVLVFFDGDDPRQVSYALSRYRKEGAYKVRMSLTSGAPLELMREHKVQFYFDQSGRLAMHFNLKHVPAVVEREGNKLRISELLP